MGKDFELRTALSKVASRRAVLAGTAGAAALSLAYMLGDRIAFDQRGPESSETATSAIQEGAGLEREEARLSHLLRRTGFGVTREEFDRYIAMGVEATTDELINYEFVDDQEAIELARQVSLQERNPGAAVAWWLARIGTTRRPLQEKMTFFWHGLLTSQISVVKDPNAMIEQNEFLRANAFAAFPDILKGISHDRAMMIYLDIAGSQKSSPNENYARELMELFSLGVGNFSEDDVRQAARSFTGWRVPRQRGDDGRPTLLEPRFFERQYDDGAKTVLGQTGEFGPDEIIDIIVEQPASATFITGRLFSYFIYPEPDAETLEPFIDVYNASGRSIGATVEAMLRSEVFYSARAYRSLVKSPVEYAVSAAKALGLQQNLVQTLATGGARRDGAALGQMGQVLFEPPNVAGWPGGPSWLNSSTIFARLNFLDALTSGEGQPGRGDVAAIDEPDFGSLETIEQVLDHFLPLLLDDNVTEESRAALLAYAGGSGAVLSPDQLRDVVYLILASPEFHLA